MAPVLYAGAMERLPKLRSDEKLPRGSYFYIQVGHRFYAGEIAETIEVEVSNRPVVVTYYQKGGSPSAALAKRWAESGRYSFRRGSNRARRARDVRKGTLANYAKINPHTERSYRRELTGKLSPKLVDTQAEAKQYRRQDRVDSACERLRACYEGLDVKVSVRYEKGETQ